MLCSSVWFGSFMCFWMDDWMDVGVFDVVGWWWIRSVFGILDVQFIQLTNCQTVCSGYDWQDL